MFEGPEVSTADLFQTNKIGMFSTPAFPEPTQSIGLSSQFGVAAKEGEIRLPEPRIEIGPASFGQAAAVSSSLTTGTNGVAAKYDSVFSAMTRGVGDIVQESAQRLQGPVPQSPMITHSFPAPQRKGMRLG